MQAPDQLPEGGEFTRYTRRFGFLDLVDSVWVAERLDHLKEAHFRCTVSGTYARFALTQARDHTFVELEAGMLPTTARWRVMNVFGGPVFRRWVGQLLDALSDTVGRRTSKQVPSGQPQA